MLELTRQDGQSERVPVANFRRGLCTLFFSADIAFDGNDPVYLFKQTASLEHIDSWGRMCVDPAPARSPQTLNPQIQSRAIYGKLLIPIRAWPLSFH